MSNVVQFPGNTRFGTVTESTDPDYLIEVRWTPFGCNWQVLTKHAAVLDEDRVAADIAAIALSLRPPPLTLFERLRILFTGA